MIKVLHIDSKKAYTLCNNSLHRPSEADQRFVDLSREVSRPFMDAGQLGAIVRELLELGGYIAVAEVATDNLDAAYRDTNHIDCAWQQNEAVTALAQEARSSSVGDVFIHDGTAYVVASFGFERLDGLEVVV